MNTRVGRHLPTVAARAMSVLSVVIALGMMGATSATARSFPVPSCNWTPASLVGATFNDPVRLETKVWSTDFAPLLTCTFVEHQPKFQFGDVPITVTVTYAENQRFAALNGSTYVRGLGRCLRNNACPRPHEPAWLLVRRRVTGLQQYVSLVDLRVQDGLNAIEITVENPYGPLKVTSEVGQVERLARGVLRKFSWG